MGQRAGEWPHRSPLFRASQVLWCALPFSYISLFTWCQHIHSLFMRLWKLYLAERILELREMRTCDCDPWNSPEVTRRLMEIFQTWVFFLQDYDIEEILYPTQEGWGRSTKLKIGWRVHRLGFLPHCYSQVFKLHTACPHVDSPALLWPLYSVHGAIFLPLN